MKMDSFPMRGNRFPEMFMGTGSFLSSVSTEVSF